MKKIRTGFWLTIVLSLIFISLVSAQSNQICSNATTYYTKHIPYLYKLNKMDSITTCIRHWGEATDNSEELTRLKILWAIKNGTFEEGLYNHRIIEHLMHYREKVQFEENIASLSNLQREIKKYQFSDVNFNEFTKNLATTLSKQNKPEDSLERLFIEFYHNKFDSFFIELNNPNHKQSKLFSYYTYSLHNIRNSYEQMVSVVTGYWWPSGNMANLDNHPLIGLRMGFKRNGNAIQLNAFLRFFEGDDKVLVNSRGGTQDSYFLRSYYFSIESQRDIFQDRYSEFSIGAGFGIEHLIFHLPFDDLSEHDEQEMLVNFNLGYKHYWTHNLSQFSEFQLNLIRYRAFWEKSDYAISLRMSFGINFAPRKNSLLKYLNY